MRGNCLADVLAAGLAVCLASTHVNADKTVRYAVRGMVMRVAPSHRSFVVLHDSVRDFMDAMTMSFDVRDPKSLDGVEPGAMVEFTLVVTRDSAYAEHVRTRPYETSEQDPLTARRLKLLKEMSAPRPRGSNALAVGQVVPDFRLIDQQRRTVTLSQFRGKTVALNFIYTSCALPQFCFRSTNNLGVIQKRFSSQVGRSLVLMTITFDPVHDQPERLAEYASQWNANADLWHFLTGAVAEVERVCAMFGVDFFQDEGLFNHSTHTALIDGQGRLVANIEGNQFTAKQLGDLVETTLKR